MSAHRWSGWPGAWCLDCGVEDPREACAADHPFDCARPACVPGPCPEPGSVRFDPYAPRKEPPMGEIQSPVEPWPDDVPHPALDVPAAPPPPPPPPPVEVEVEVEVDDEDEDEDDDEAPEVVDRSVRIVEVVTGAVVDIAFLLAIVVMARSCGGCH
jgi:hypothetical protein